MEETSGELVATGKGILAADESSGTIEKRFKANGIPATEENRRAYRELLFTVPGVGQFLSGVILNEESIRQTTTEGIGFVEMLGRQKIIPGIKVDKGTTALAGYPQEMVTEGLDGLRERLAEYVRLGARFTKWRAIFATGPDLPSQVCVDDNALALARFASLSQEAGLVPIVEPEVLMDGDHAIERCSEVTERVLSRVFLALTDHRVNLKAMLLKPNMVLPGLRSAKPAGVSEVAVATLDCMRRVVPAAVPGIVFLSGGQDEIAATQHLNALARLGEAPWALSFSYGRALQNSALQLWGGETANAKAAQTIFFHRAKCNSAARFGNYNDELETELTTSEAI